MDSTERLTRLESIRMAAAAELATYRRDVREGARAADVATDEALQERMRTLDRMIKPLLASVPVRHYAVRPR